MILDICTSDQNIRVSAFARVVVVILPLDPHLAIVFVQASIQACASAARSSASWPTAGALFFHSSIHFCASAAFASASLAAGAGGAAFFSAGAAFAAGLAVGVWDSTEALTELNGVEASFEPIIGKDACEAKLTRWQDAVTRTFDLA